jgi:2-methylisocitrate lyase-like PEP mutase family enzyme
VATARAVVAAGFPVVATTSAGVAGTLGYEDHEGAPGDEMLAAAARIAAGVDVPVTIDAEAGYGMDPGELAQLLLGALGRCRDCYGITVAQLTPARHGLRP